MKRRKKSFKRMTGIFQTPDGNLSNSLQKSFKQLINNKT